MLYVAGTFALIFVTGALKLAYDWFSRLEVEHSIPQHSGQLDDPAFAKKVKTPSLEDPATKSLSIIVPAYNEGDRLRPTLTETLVYLTKRRDREGRLFTSEIIVVDDGSRDDTVQIAYEFVKRYGFDSIRVLVIPRNKGKGHAVKAGMMIARGATLLFMDADGATKVSDMEKLEKSMSSTCTGKGPERLGMAVGSRVHLESEAIAKRHWFRNFLMRGFHLLVVMVAGSKIRDTQCGFKMFTRGAAQRLFPNQRLQRWCFDVELVFLAQRTKIPISEVCVTWTEIAGSKIKFTSILHMSWELLAVFVGYKSGFWSVRLPAHVLNLGSQSGGQPNARS